MKKLMDNDKDILCAFQYGSRVYGTHTEKSDYDFVIVVRDNTSDNYESYSDKNCDYNIYSEEEWRKMVLTNDIVAVECLSLPPEFVIKNNICMFLHINSIELRKSLSAISSNSFVKCKKKLTVLKDIDVNVGKKSLWHSIRILMFGIQCYKYGEIVNFSEANNLYDDIMMSDSEDWLYYKRKYQKLYNKTKSEFKKYSEKEWLEYKNNDDK